MISAPSYAKRISSHEVRYHTEDISPVPSGRDIIAKRLFCLADKRGALHGTLVGIRKHFFAGYFGAGIPPPNVCEKIKEFASVCTGSCRPPVWPADMVRILPPQKNNSHPDGWLLFFLKPRKRYGTIERACKSHFLPYRFRYIFRVQNILYFYITESEGTECMCPRSALPNILQG